MSHLWRTEGVAGLQRGLTTAYFREFIQNVPRLGLYAPLVAAFRRADGTAGNGTPDAFHQRFVAAVACGATGGVFSNPAEIVKARIQSGRYTYGGPFSGLATIMRKEGILAWFKGADASAARCMVGTSSQLIAQTYTLDMLLGSPAYRQMTREWSPTATNWLANCAAGLVSGVFLSCCMQPFDTARTRLYSQPTNADGSGTLYRTGVLGMIDAIIKTHRLEGVRGLYKGLAGNILRQGPHMALAFR